MKVYRRPRPKIFVLSFYLGPNFPELKRAVLARSSNDLVRRRIPQIISDERIYQERIREIQERKHVRQPADKADSRIRASAFFSAVRNRSCRVEWSCLEHQEPIKLLCTVSWTMHRYSRSAIEMLRKLDLLYEPMGRIEEAAAA